MFSKNIPDQAEGLRRILAGPTSRTMVFLSAVALSEKNAVLLNLATTLARAHNEVHLLDACQTDQGFSLSTIPHLPLSLWDVAEQRCTPKEAILEHSPYLHISKLSRQQVTSLVDQATALKKLDQVFKASVKDYSFALIDADVTKDNVLVVPQLAAAEMVILVNPTAESIKSAYTLVKTVHAQLGQHTFNILVVGATGDKADLIQHNIGIAANRYLGVKLTAMGCIPIDAQLVRSSHMGRSIVEAYPLSPASAAFRAIAAQLIEDLAMPVIAVQPKEEMLA